MEPRIQYAKTSDGVSIAYWTLGAGQPIVCLPPFVWSHLQLEWQDPLMRAWYEEIARTRRLIRYDFRGQGLSERNVADLSFETFLQDLDAVADHLELENFALSCTGPNTPLTVTYTVRHPGRVSHLIVWSPQLTVVQTGTAGAALLDVAGKNWRTYTESVAQSAFGWSEGDTARAFAGFIRRSVDQETWLETIKQFDDVDATPLLEQVTAATLVLARPQSRGYNANHVSTLASRIPNARLVFLAGTEPGLNLGDADEGLRAIDEFLSEGEEPSDSELAALPAGTAIILFLDIADSTALTTKLGDAAYRERERGLDATLRAAITEAGGTPVEGKVLGDGVMAVFTSARQAIEAAQRCRDLGNAAELPLHLGIHAGDVVRERAPDGRDNVHGGAVQLASRVQSAAAPGEILVSQTVRDLARTSAGVAFEDRGEHELKGIAEPQRLFAVRQQG